MNYYCEPPRNLEGSYDNGHIELNWEAPEFFGQGLLAYDDQLDLGYEALTATQANYNTTENLRYNVTAIWDGRETEFSNTIYLGPSVGIEEITTTEKSIEVYPNPVRDCLTLNGDGILHLSLFTITGACVLESTANHNKVEIDMSAMPQGMYIMRVQTKEGIVVRKIVKE